MTKRRAQKKIIAKLKGYKNYSTFYLTRSIQGCTQITRAGTRWWWRRLTAFHTRHVAGRRLLFRLCIRSYTYDDGSQTKCTVCVSVCVYKGRFHPGWLVKNNRHVFTQKITSLDQAMRTNKKQKKKNAKETEFF